MNVTELREKSVTELEQLCRDTERELCEVRIKRGTGEEEQPMRIRTLRRLIARAKTLLNEKRGEQDG